MFIKIWTNRGKSNRKNEEISRWEAQINICFDSHRGLSQSEEDKCMQTHCKDGATWQFQVEPPGKEQEEGRMKEKLNGNYLRLIPYLIPCDNSIQEIFSFLMVAPIHCVFVMFGNPSHRQFEVLESLTHDGRESWPSNFDKSLNTEPIGPWKKIALIHTSVYLNRHR